MPDLLPNYTSLPDTMHVVVHPPSRAKRTTVQEDEVPPAPKQPLHNCRQTGEPQLSESQLEVNCVRGPWRVAYLALAGLFFVLGMVGVVLPGLPTTPFLLLTSYFLARSWPRMHAVLVENRFVGPILRQWQRSRTIEPRVKIHAMAMVVAAIVFLLYFSGLQTTVLATVLGLAIIGLLVVASLPTANHETV